MDPFSFFFFQHNKKTLGETVIFTFDDFIMVDVISTYKVSNNYWGHSLFVIIHSNITVVPINIFQRPENNNYQVDHNPFKLI